METKEIKKDPLSILEVNHKKTILSVLSIIKKAFSSIEISPDKANELIGIITPELQELIESSRKICYNAVNDHLKELARRSRRKDILGRIVIQKIEPYFSIEDPDKRISRDVIEGILNVIGDGRFIGNDIMEGVERECKDLTKKYMKHGQIEWDNLMEDEKIVEIHTKILEELKRNIMSTKRGKSFFVNCIRKDYYDFDEKDYENLIEHLFKGLPE
jgi:hypothetical protein